MPKQSTVKKGDAFEEVIADLFGYFPNATVQRQVRIAGKTVDIVLVLSSALTGDSSIAIDAKDYARPLTRDQVEAELVSYHSVLQSREIDGFFLVTRNGIVAGGKQALDAHEKKCRHFTVADIQDQILQPRSLLQAAATIFQAGNLDKYYIKTKCESIDLSFQHTNYSELYHPFMTFSVAGHYEKLSEASKVWLTTPRGRRMGVPRSINEVKYRKYFSVLGGYEPEKNDLEEVIDEWINNQDMRRGIALLGTYGTGKSSFGKRIAFKYAESYRSAPNNRLPLLIELREFGSHQDIQSLVTHTLVNKYGISNGGYALFEKMNRAGKYFIILDGFDEMKQGMTSDALRYNFSELNRLMVGGAKVLLCGRPTIFESDAEKSGLLSGDSDFVGNETQASYIPIRISRLERDEISRLARGYAQHSLIHQYSQLESKISELEKELSKTNEIADLLSRPVHIPMLLTILPEHRGAFSDLNRGVLYDEFIRQIIRREVVRLPAAYRNRYSEDSRMKFACLLAREIARAGDARSIRTSEIPEQILRPFVQPGETIDIARRDLVQACCMDSKPPDLLVFGHKSFLEFLWAKLIIETIRSGAQNEEIFDVADGLNGEVLSFVLDLLEVSDISTLPMRPIFAQRIILNSLRAAVKYVSFSDIGSANKKKKDESVLPNNINLFPISITFDERSKILRRIFMEPEYFLTIMEKISDEIAIQNAVAVCCLYCCERGGQSAVPLSVLSSARARSEGKSSESLVLDMLISFQDKQKRTMSSVEFREFHDAIISMWYMSPAELLKE